MTGDGWGTHPNMQLSKKDTSPRKKKIPEKKLECRRRYWKVLLPKLLGEVEGNDGGRSN